MNRVLFVDDEPLILNALKRGLINEPYEQLFALSGEAALQLLEEHEVSILVTDMRMPGMSGLELLKRVKERYPEVVKLVLSGYTHLPQVLVTVNQGDIFKFITKPWNLDSELRDVIKEALDYYNYQAAVRKAGQALERKNASFQNIVKTYDDKLLAVRDEMGIMVEMCRRWFKLQDRLMRSNENAMEFSWVPLSAFSQLPLSDSRLGMDKFMEMLQKSLQELEFTLHVDMAVNENAPHALKGPWNLAGNAVQLLMSLLLQEDEDGQVNLSLTAKRQEDGQWHLSVQMDARKQLYHTEPARTLAVGWLAEWIARFGGTLTAREQGDRRMVTVTVPFDE